MNYIPFFKEAMGSEMGPYHYQTRLALEPWPQMINVATGMGKTAGIILSWLYKRLQKDPATPRRMIYCLPMRVLVEQTSINAERWITNLVKAEILPINLRPHVQVLMGGEIDNDWDMLPDKDSILIGTQDQLLSRALNRGYGMSRFRWPAHFGLLNNDCLWVLDEVQLMGSGLATSVQLQAFRARLGMALPVKSVWMSATLDKGWLKTVDFDASKEIQYELSLSDRDKKSIILERRFEAKKPLARADCSHSDFKRLADQTLSLHRRGTKTLVILNTVKRATALYEELKKRKLSALVSLLHSRFRPPDRTRSLENLLMHPPQEGTICISTQVVEAGVDVSATTLITDLAPWPSLVQRFGRCNREGLDKEAKIVWIDLDWEKKGSELPYNRDELAKSLTLLKTLEDAAPKNLPKVDEEVYYRHVLRLKDIMDLFDTTPDLAGADVDISRFIRETEELDLQVYWRDLPEKGPENSEPMPSRDELCSVSASDLSVRKDMDMWCWNLLDKSWSRPRSLYPGQRIMLRKQNGCYSSEKGWTGNRNDIPGDIPKGNEKPEGSEDDFYSEGFWQTLQAHTDSVAEELETILLNLNLQDLPCMGSLRIAARWHDAGKDHDVFQKAMLGDPPEADPSLVWAKTARRNVRYERWGFRHELASALAMLQHRCPDLAVYLAAAHHGKVRLSIRSQPNEMKPRDAGIRFARGVWDKDVLPEVDLGGGQLMPKTILDLSCMEFGDGPYGPSWTGRILNLRDNSELGPFRLAFYEALLRAADRSASKGAIQDAQPT